MTFTSRRNLLYGLLALAVAGVVMARTLSLFPPYIDDIIGRSFPLVLVILGLSVLLRNRIPFSSFIAVVLSATLITAITTTAFSVRRGQNRDDNRIEITEDMGETVALLRVRVSTLATDVEFALAPAGSDRQVRALFLGSTENTLNDLYVESTDGSATFTITELRTNPLPLLEAIGRGTLLIELPPDTGVDIQLDAADGDVTMNLADVNLERLNLNIVEGDALVTLPEYAPAFSTSDETLGTWRVGTGALTVRIPEDVSARFDMSQSVGLDPEYDPNVYNLLFGRDVLEARNIDLAEIVMRYNLIVQRDRLNVTVTEDNP
ncbi:MAG: hypothetical protein AAF787_18560 [Chloroflexota bacterium]